MNKNYNDSPPNYLLVIPPTTKRRPIPERARQFIDKAVSAGAQRAERLLDQAILMQQPKQRN